MIRKLEKVMDLLEQAEYLEEQANRASELRNRLCERELIISVIGQFKRGKSSLINAMLGDELLPVGIIPLTASVTEIRQGNRFRATVLFIDGSEKEISREELPDYISEQKNRDNQKNVAAVRLWTMHTPFGSCVTLVDTLGVGSIHQHNTETSYSYMEKSDAVLFLLSVDSPISEVERDFLIKTREHAAKFFFAINETDTTTEKSLLEFISYCKTVLSEIIGFSVTLCPVSAKTSAGITALVEKLTRDIGASHNDLLEKSVSIKLDAVISQAKAKLSLFLTAAAIPVEDMESKLAQIWEKQKELSSFSDDVLVLAKKQMERLVEHIKEQLEYMCAEMRSEIEAEASRIYDSLKSLQAKKFESRILAIFESILYQKLNRERF